MYSLNGFRKSTPPRNRQLIDRGPRVHCRATHLLEGLILFGPNMRFLLGVAPFHVMQIGARVHRRAKHLLEGLCLTWPYTCGLLEGLSLFGANMPT